MIGFTFRPLSSSATYLKRIARRLADKLRGRGGVKVEVRDGFLLRAVGSERAVTVTAIDPEALWWVLGHDALGSLYPFSRFLSALNRAHLRPGGTTELPSPVGVVPTKLGWAPGFGYLPPVGTMNSFGLIGNIPASLSIRPYRVATTHAAFDRSDVPAWWFDGDAYEMRAYLYGHTASPLYRKAVGPEQDMSDVPVRNVDAYDWLVSEHSLRSLFSDQMFQLRRRGGNWQTLPDRSNGEANNVALPYAGAQTSRDVLALPEGADGLWYSDVVVGGAFVTQPSRERAGQQQTGVFLLKLRRPDPEDMGGTGDSSYPLTVVFSAAVRAENNPFPQLRPTFLPKLTFTTSSGAVIEYFAKFSDHSVLSVGAFTTPAEEGEGFGLLTAQFCTQAERYVVGDAVEENVLEYTSAVQLTTLSSAVDVTADYLCLERTGADAIATFFGIGPDMTLRGESGALVVEARLALPHDVLRLWHIDAAGNSVETDLATHGWEPFTAIPRVRNLVGTYGQGMQWAVPIGGGLIAMLANPVGTGDGATIAWGVITIDEVTGEFVSHLGSLPPVSNLVFLTTHIGCVAPRTVDAGGAELTPAVLTVTLYGTTYLSRDGGATWSEVFEANGCPLYVGNSLRRVPVGSGL